MATKEEWNEERETAKMSCGRKDAVQARRTRLLVPAAHR